jgi:PPK2 family polyphosphate:nucleotide phosphotransferase
MAHALKVKPGEKIKLSEISTRAPKSVERAKAEAKFEALAAELGELQELLYASSSQAVLVVLQGVDTSGKDGSIRSVFKDVNPQGCRVASFKVPTPLELAHDFLWRIHQQTPAKGMIGVFNRSHYEDVVVVRVHELAPESVWEKRYEHINCFEQNLVDSGVIVLKFYLHISKEEQEERLVAREHDVSKAWKLSAADWVERRSWDKYQEAYEDAITKCSTEDAPWRIVPADQKWWRNLVITEALVDALKPKKAEWLKELELRGEEELKAIRAARAQRQKGAGTLPSS